MDEVREMGHALGWQRALEVCARIAEERTDDGYGNMRLQHPMDIAAAIRALPRGPGADKQMQKPSGAATERRSPMAEEPSWLKALHESYDSPLVFVKEVLGLTPEEPPVSQTLFLKSVWVPYLLC